LKILFPLGVKTRAVLEKYFQKKRFYQFQTIMALLGSSVAAMGGFF